MFGEGEGIREGVSGGWEEEVRGEGWEYEYDKPGQMHQEYQLETQTEDEMGHGVPYGGSTLPWEHSYLALDSPFTDNMYTMPTQGTYQSPPLSPLLQLEMPSDYPYLGSPTPQPFTLHHPTTQSLHSTYQDHPRFPQAKGTPQTSHPGLRHETQAPTVTIHTLFLLSLTLVYTIPMTTPLMTHFSHTCVYYSHNPPLMTHFSHTHVHHSHDHSTSDSLLSQLLHYYLRIVYIEPDTHCRYPT